MTKKTKNNLNHLQFYHIKNISKSNGNTTTGVHVVMRFQSACNAKITNVVLDEFVEGVAANVVITEQNVWRDARVHRQYKSIPMFHIQPHPPNGSRK